MLSVHGEAGCSMEDGDRLDVESINAFRPLEYDILCMIR